MKLTSEQISNMERVERLKLINSICGIRSVHLIGTRSSEDVSNLAIFSSVTHLGSNPSLLGFVCRPSKEVKRDTLTNILSSNSYTINSIHQNMIDRAHMTSGKFDSRISEFSQCKFDELYIDHFYAPFVKESKIKLGLNFLESIPITHNNTCLVVGEIKIIDYDKNYIDEGFEDGVGVVGLNSYFGTNKIKDLEYYRVKK